MLTYEDSTNYWILDTTALLILVTYSHIRVIIIEIKNEIIDGLPRGWSSQG